jgi:hypothetical protein
MTINSAAATSTIEERNFGRFDKVTTAIVGVCLITAHELFTKTYLR